MKENKSKTSFKERLDNLVVLGKKKRGVLEQTDVNEIFSDIELNPDQIEIIYERLEDEEIDVLDNIADDDEDDDKEGGGKKKKELEIGRAHV